MNRPPFPPAGCSITTFTHIHQFLLQRVSCLWCHRLSVPLKGSRPVSQRFLSTQTGSQITRLRVNQKQTTVLRLISQVGPIISVFPISVVLSSAAANDSGVDPHIPNPSVSALVQSVCTWILRSCGQSLHVHIFIYSGPVIHSRTLLSVASTPSKAMIKTTGLVWG